jgi:hypothetical protein
MTFGLYQTKFEFVWKEETEQLAGDLLEKYILFTSDANY